jgi:hypothetical protein
MHSGATSHDETSDHREMWDMTRLTHIRTDRRRILAGAAALFAGTVVLRKAGAQGAPARAPEHAIFTEFSPESKLLKAGWNTRVFTHTDARRGNGIQCDFATGIITLAPGSYHFSGVSMVAYMSGGEPAEMTTVRAPASAGYCRLRTVGPNRVLNPGMRDVDNADASVICIGSPGTANLTASVFEAYRETDKTVDAVLEHQSGSNPEQIYLRVFTQNSPWHAMARISIRTT